MASYNLIDENWIKVKYLDGVIKEIGIRQCFEDAEKIDDIIPPTFRRDTATIYYVPLLRLLTTIVMSAYFKPEQNFASSNFKYLKKFQNTIYTNVIKDYLDKWYDRFDILSKEHPFLQNKDILGKVKDNDSFWCWNPFAPSANNKVFGKNRSQNINSSSLDEQYTLTFKEYTYYLLYTASMGVYPSAKVSLETSLEAKSCLYVCLKGKNLKETICVNLLKVLWDEDILDKPIWEFDGVYSVKEYYEDDLEKISTNILLCNFYPGISIMHTSFSDKVITGIVRTGKETIESATLDQNITKELSNIYFSGNSIKCLDKNSNICYKQFNVGTDTASSICISATGRLDDTKDYHYSCSLLDSLETKKDICEDIKVRIFFRVFDGMKVSLFQCGEISGYNMNTWELLCDKTNNEKSIKYQETYKKLRGIFKGCMSSIYKPFIGGDGKKVDSKSFESECQVLSDFVETDFFTAFTDDLKNSVETPIYNFVERAYKFMLDRINRNISYSNSMIDTVNALNTFNSKIASLKKKEEGH